MNQIDRAIISTDRVYPYLGSAPTCAELHYYAIKGFEIPTMPALAPEYSQERGELIKLILYRFQQYLAVLHESPHRRAIALQIMSHPELSTLNSRIRAYILCRTAASDLTSACDDAELFADTALNSFPQEGVFNYGSPRWLSTDDTERVLFRDVEDPSRIEIIEIRKCEELQNWSQQPWLQYVPHRFWADTQRDPWQALIETLASMKQKAAVRIELTPTRLTPEAGLDYVSTAGRWFEVICEDLERKASQGEQVRTDGVVTTEMLRQDEVARASANKSTTAFVRRGRHVYQQLISFSNHVFCMRVILAAEGHVSDSVIGSVSAALSTPPAGGELAAIGWGRPSVVRPKPGEAADALNSLRLMVQNRWGRSTSSAAVTGNKVDLRAVVTPEEAVALFHLPIYDRAGQTSALSTAESPFVIPPETLAAEPAGSKKKVNKIAIGYLYQREKLLDQSHAAGGEQLFQVTINDLMKPSLLVGAPGSGKTNLALWMLIQLWRDHKIPFMVLDPSTGQEFRLLQAEPSLKNDLVVYSVGDANGLPLQFNPFSIPPDVNVRNHTTRILAAFRAAFEMYDPVPAIYEAALERVYTSARYSPDGRVSAMSDKGRIDSPAPTLSNLAAAIADEVQETATSLYQGSAESIGVIRGASTIRVNAIGKKLGHIINVEGNSSEFLATMLRRPVVIEMGGLGDSSNIALVMAFLLTQLAGQVEDAFRRDRSRQHVMFIEEAHRLLAGGDGHGASGKSAEDLNMMLAEVRKFGQGILVMDQRPSSLVGGVLDNAFIKILTRLSDRVGFERLSDELNLNEAQQRFARTRLKAGDAILLDRDAGQPVLTRSYNAKGELERNWPGDDAFARQNAANAANAGLMPPPSVRYVQPSAGEPKKPVPSKAPPIPGARDWLSRQITEQIGVLLETLRKDGKLYHAANNRLVGEAPDVAAAKAAIDETFEAHRGDFDKVVGDLCEKLKWALVSVVAEEKASSAVQDQVNALRAAPLDNAATATPSILMGSAGPLKVEIARLYQEIETILDRQRRNSGLYYNLKSKMLAEPPETLLAEAVAKQDMKAYRGEFDAMSEKLWSVLPQILVGRIAADKLSEQQKAEVLAWAMRKNAGRAREPR